MANSHECTKVSTIAFGDSYKQRPGGEVAILHPNSLLFVESRDLRSNYGHRY